METGLVMRDGTGSGHTVCLSCRTVSPGAWTACPACGSGAVEAHGTRMEAEARAAGLWLAEGYAMVDVADRYWNPVR